MHKNILQTWRTPLPEGILKYCSDTWKKFNPDWKYLYLDDTQLSSIIKQINRPLFDKYEDTDISIKKYDVYRLAYIYEYGGLYADIDIICHKNIDSLIGDNRGMLFEEHPCDYMSHIKSTWGGRVLTNSIFYFLPKDKFLRRILNDLLLYTRKPITDINYDESSKIGHEVITETGTLFLTTQYNKYRNLYQYINIQPCSKFELFNKHERREMVIKKEIIADTSQSYGTHLNMGSWCGSDNIFRYYDKIKDYDYLKITPVSL
jgi:mannosyltransferase OCH1-like enzyme